MKTLLCILCLVASLSAQDRLRVSTRRNHSVTLQWNASTTTGVSYRVYRTQTQNVYSGPLVTGISGTSYIDTSVRGGLHYWYIVRAFDPKTNQESTASNEVQALIPTR